MEAEAWGLVLAAASGVLVLCPWWTRGRARARVLRCRRALRGRHRFALPAVDPGRVWVGARLRCGRAVGQLADGQGRGGWIGWLDLWGRVHLDRWV
jgi:hypothetical protein